MQTRDYGQEGGGGGGGGGWWASLGGLVRRIVGWGVPAASGPPLLAKVAAEFTGCMIFHFLGSVSPTPMTNATALAVLVYYTAKMSGAHLNPAVTTTFVLLGHTTPLEMVAYWAAQVSGCIAGALWVAALTPGGLRASDTASLGCFSPAQDATSLAQAFGWEAVCTFCFILPIFSVVWYTQTKSGYGNTGPLIVGLSLYAAASAAGPWTGGALNPARAIASPVVFRACGDARAAMWYYVLGQLAGACAVPLAVAPWYGVSPRLLQLAASADDDAADDVADEGQCRAAAHDGGNQPALTRSLEIDDLESASWNQQQQQEQQQGNNPAILNTTTTTLTTSRPSNVTTLFGSSTSVRRARHAAPPSLATENAYMCVTPFRRRPPTHGHVRGAATRAHQHPPPCTAT
jgi:glycerol uptake facilitator-like aquaporin